MGVSGAAVAISTDALGVQHDDQPSIATQNREVQRRCGLALRNLAESILRGEANVLGMNTGSCFNMEDGHFVTHDLVISLEIPGEVTVRNAQNEIDRDETYDPDGAY